MKTKETVTRPDWTLGLTCRSVRKKNKTNKKDTILGICVIVSMVSYKKGGRPSLVASLDMYVND